MLRRLELQGFKTFAARTALDLELGVTAVVGPNGSGKSNLTEAVRWVLGEQSMKAIRGRRTEDVIFAGSGRRPPAGMAEVTVTLDNSAGLLPLPFAEVSVTRRAYRSGDNEYLINGERSRLRDVTDLLSRAGLAANGHVVVGQGLVDAALSARPEERRTLFEDAAGISHHQARLSDSRDKLLLTEQNLARVADIAAEIAPRLPQLARQAERARQAISLKAELERLLLGWYGSSWSDARARVRSLEEAASVASVEAADLAVTYSAVDGRVAEFVQDRDAARVAVVAADQSAREARSRAESARLDLAVARERMSDLSARLEATEQDTADAAGDRDATELSLAAAKAALSQAEARLQEAILNQSSKEREAAALLTARRDRDSALKAAEAEWSRAALLAAETRARAAGGAERRQALVARIARLRAALPDSDRRVVSATSRLKDLESSLAEVDRQLETLATARAASDEALGSARLREQTLIGERNEVERSLHQLEARRDLLTGWRDSQSGYYSGVRAVLQAARRPASPHGRLSGVLGPVGELVQVPAELETAIETALGAHLQDLVVESWNDAEAAITFLKNSAAGRATFLPLDAIRSSQSRPPNPETGVLGVARDLVTFDPRLAVVFDLLLGHTLVVSDLQTARRMLRQVTGGWQIVTTSGEIVRSSGAVTGGSATQSQRGVLSRERELRQLPEQIERLSRELQAKASQVSEVKLAEQESLLALSRARRFEQELVVTRRERSAAVTASGRDLAAAAHQAELDLGEIRRLEAELERLMAGEAGAGRQIEEADDRAATLRRSLDSLRTAAERFDLSDRAFESALADLRSARAVAESERRSAAEDVRRVEASLEQALRRLADRDARLQSLRGERASASSSVTDAEAVVRMLNAEAERASAEIGPASSRLNEMEASVHALEVKRNDARRALDECREDERHAALLAERARVEVAGLRRQIELDFGLVEERGDELLVPVGEALVPLDGTAGDGSDPTRRILELRRLLRGAGSASPEVVAEYEAAKLRYEFLTTQAADLQSASATLQQAVDELEETMRQRFVVTFDAVASVFERNFTRLFGGGSASLSLALPEKPAESGVEITVQLPGKRWRSLAQLSGGERSLTAVALIFALLEVNPTPFCVFDEVDAALDEANIDRFCELLKERSLLTQFVVITHNRRTMESAGALYGLSMEDRAVTRVFSLKLEDVPL